MTKPNKSLVIDEETNSLLRRIAEEEDRSQSSLIRIAIRHYAHMDKDK